MRRPIWQSGLDCLDPAEVWHAQARIVPILPPPWLAECATLDETIPPAGAALCDHGGRLFPHPSCRAVVDYCVTPEAA